MGCWRVSRFPLIICDLVELLGLVVLLLGPVGCWILCVVGLRFIGPEALLWNDLGRVVSCLSVSLVVSSLGVGLLVF